MEVLSQFTFDIISMMIQEIIKENIDLSKLEFFKRRRIEARIDNAVAEVVEPLIPFLDNEIKDEAGKRLLIGTCVKELRLLVDDAKILFQGSLDG